MRPATVAERVSRRLAGLAPTATWRVAAAFSATVVSVCATTGGLFSYAPEAQAALLGGVCASLIAPSRRSAVIVAATATTLGLVAGPANPMMAPRPVTVVVAAAVLAGLLSGVVALAAKVLAARAPGSDRWLTWAAIALLVANVWGSAIHSDRTTQVFDGGRTYASPFKVLSGTVVLSPVGDAGDEYAYLQVLKDVKQGRSFYQAWYDELGPTHRADTTAGSSVVNYNLPTRFWFWAALPGTPVSVVYAYLALVSMAVIAVPFVVRGTVRLPLAIPGAAAVAAYLFMFGGSLLVMAGEPWAGALGVLSLAAWARSSVSRRWKTWTVVAVVLAVSAVAVREPAALIPIAGFASAVFVRDERRRFRLCAWATGLVVFAGLYAAHYVNVRPLLTGSPIGPQFVLSGLGTIVSALTRGTPTLGASGALPLALAGAGILGMLLLRDRRTSLFALVATISTLLAFLVVNNGARDLVTGAAVNYWGPVIVPTIYACVPALFAVLPAMGPGSGSPSPSDSDGIPQAGGRGRA